MKKFLKIIGSILLVIIVIAGFVYFIALQYPKLKENPTIGKWYKVTDSEMRSADGGSSKAFIKKGTENKVMIYFAGGGVNYDEYTARNQMFNHKAVEPDYLANVTMNMGGLALDNESNPFQDWTIILFPYTTGDFNSGAGIYEYTDENGNLQKLYHYGYTNYQIVMDKIMKFTDISNADALIVTGYSAGGWSGALLADDIFSNYFPNTENKTLLVDSSLLLNDNWHDIAMNVWHAPESITEKLVGNNIVLDCTKALKDKYGDTVNVLFDSSTRDGDLAKNQNYIDYGVMNVTEKDADIYQQILKETIPQLKEAGAYVFIWDGLPWYDDPRNLTMHTIIASPFVWMEFSDSKKSVGQWLDDAVNGLLADYGLDLLDKTYEYTE